MSDTARINRNAFATLTALVATADEYTRPLVLELVHELSMYASISKVEADELQLALRTYGATMRLSHL